jgi:hypothetical protein
MNLLQSVNKFLFGYSSYRKGLKIHLLLFTVYSLCFIAAYFILDSFVATERFSFYQLRLSRYLVGLMTLHLLLLVFLRWEEFKKQLVTYFTEKGSPYNLAVFRIVFFFILAGHFTFYTFEKEISWTYLPHSSRVPLPFIGWLINNLPITPGIYTACSILAAIFSFLVCIGLFTRYAQLLLLPFAFYILGVPMFFGKLNHHHILLWIPVLFCFSPVADVWSIDALIQKKNVTPSARYMLPFKFLWLQLAVIYLFAGIVKLWDCGLSWALGDNMLNQMRWEWVEHYDKVPAFRLDLYPVLAKSAGIAVIWFELLYFLLILKPSGRFWAFAGAFVFHILCGYFMYIDFSTLRLIAISYIDWHALSLKLRKKKTSNPYDASEIQDLKKSLQTDHLLPAFRTGSILVGLNFLCSLFHIHSYPFSSYPTYSAMVPDRIATLRMDAYDSSGHIVPVKAIGRRNHFRWETFRPYEMRIAEAYHSRRNSELNYKLEEYWLLWKNNVKGLDDVRKVVMRLETTSIVPEERGKILSSDSLGTIYPQ